MNNHPQRCNALFFIDGDADRAGEIQGILRYRLKFQHHESHDAAYKVIMLPASERNTAWSHFQIHGSGESARCRLATQERFSFRGRREQNWDHQWIEHSLYQFTLHQARARTQRKMLPGYDIESSFFTGVIDNVSIEATVEVVKNGPPHMNGLYLRLGCHNYGAQSMDMLKARMLTINQGAYVVGTHLFPLLRKYEPNFPYCWDDTPVSVLARGHHPTKVQWSGLVPDGASVREVLQRAGIEELPHGMRVLGIEQETPYQFYGATMDSVVEAKQSVILSEVEGYF